MRARGVDPTLDDLGERICILGPSNSGKSTLAVAIGAARELEVVHLDRFRHQPAQHWVLRPREEFTALHDAATRGERWVIEGNYPDWWESRRRRATGLILLDSSALASAARHLRRTLMREERVGGVAGVRDRVTWPMMRHILGPARVQRVRYRGFFDAFDGPKVTLADRGALRAFVRANGLS